MGREQATRHARRNAISANTFHKKTERKPHHQREKQRVEVGLLLDTTTNLDQSQNDKHKYKVYIPGHFTDKSIFFNQSSINHQHVKYSTRQLNEDQKITQRNDNKLPSRPTPTKPISIQSSGDGSTRSRRPARRLDTGDTQPRQNHPADERYRPQSTSIGAADTRRIEHS